MDECWVGGNTPGGGLLIKRGDIRDTTVEDNFNTEDGGGLRISADATLNRVTIRGNKAGEPSSTRADGGGVYLTGIPDETTGATDAYEVTIRNSLIETNEATQNGGGVAVEGCNTTCGGAELNEANLNMVGTTVQKNRAWNTGGGVWVKGEAYIETSILHDNSAIRDPFVNVTGQAEGGGLYALGPTTIKRSSVSRNFAGNRGGGAYIYSTSRLENSTVTENTTNGDGGGVYYRVGRFTVANSTIAGNEADADQDGVGDGGGLLLATPDLPYFINSILAANEDSSQTTVWNNCAGGGDVVSYGGNVFGLSADCNLIQSVGAVAADIVGQAPKLKKPRWDGDTFVVPLAYNSPAIDLGYCGVVLDLEIDKTLEIDQRGAPRTPPICDAGAFERQ